MKLTYPTANILIIFNKVKSDKMICEILLITGYFKNKLLILC
jgi:hypothetical protein